VEVVVVEDMDQRYTRIYFPFSAIVGLEDAKLALMVNAVNPLIGGVVLAGDKGTGKSTLVRAFAQVLPAQPVTKGCSYNCNPFNPLEMCDYHYELWVRGERVEYEYKRIRVVELPLNATPDRVAGSIDIEQTIKSGRVVFKPGLLAEANRNILYIDEVNLLEDYIANLILDAAASGWNVVEREGISFKHPARFILVGSMNPEEGMLRPQILDRFGLYVPIEASRNPDERVEIVERVEEFSRDPISFYRKREPIQKQVEEKIAKAREILNNVVIDRDLLKLITETVVRLGIKTHRAEIVTVKTAKAIAALDGRTKVDLNDVVKAMELALRHRLRSKPFEEPQKKFEDIVKELTGRGSGYNQVKEGRDVEGSANSFGDGKSDKVENFMKNFSESPIELPSRNIDRSKYFSSSASRSSKEFRSVAIASMRGVAIDAIPMANPDLKDVDIVASIRACVATNPTIPIAIDPQCIRVRVREEKLPVLHIVLLDASGSMVAGKRIPVAKSIVKKLIEEAYIKKIYVSLVVFRGEKASTIAWPTRNLVDILNKLDEIPLGGSTPFTTGLLEVLKHMKMFRERFRDSRAVPHIVSDGRANVFFTKNPRREVLELAEEFKKFGVEVVAYRTTPAKVVTVPDYVKLFVEAVGGEYRSVDGKNTAG